MLWLACDELSRIEATCTKIYPMLWVNWIELLFRRKLIYV